MNRGHGSCFERTKALEISVTRQYRVNETSQISEHYSVQMKADMKQKRLVMLGQIYLSMIEYQKHDWYSAFGQKRLRYSRAMARTFILNLLYMSI